MGSIQMIDQDELRADSIYGLLMERWVPAGCIYFRAMPDRSLAAVKKQLFTYGIVNKLEWNSFAQRWCFENVHDAISALSLWSGDGDPCGPWLKTYHPERHNPNMFKQREGHPHIWDRIPANELNVCRIWPRF